MTISTDISNLPGTQPYSVSANIGANGVDVSSSAVSGSAGSTSSSSTKTSNSELGENDFLKLLVTQLQNQDPLNPMDNTQFIAQLAQFQSLSSMMSLQQSFQGLSQAVQQSSSSQAENANSIAGASAVALIGKNVRVQLSDIDWNGGSSLSIPVYLGSAESATVQVSDANGNVIKTLTAKDKDKNNVSLLSWDGTDDKGNTVDTGSYTVTVDGQASGEQYAFTDGTVSSVSNHLGKTTVQVNGMDFSLSDLITITSAGAGG